MIWARTVERWRSLIAEHANGNPVEFLLAWVSMESGGDPLATGAATECGIFQIDFQDGPKFGASVASVHKSYQSLSEADKLLQVTSGVAMVSAYRATARTRLAAIGADWTEGSSDFWSLVKLHHALPGIPRVFLPWFQESRGAAPGSWSEWRAAIDGAARAELAAAAAKYGAPSTMNYYNDIDEDGNLRLPKYPAGFGRFWRNAASAGQYGGAELGDIMTAIAVPAAVAVLAHVAGRGVGTRR